MTQGIENNNISVNEAVSGFNAILHKAGDRCLTKSKRKTVYNVKQKWFDRSCDILKQQLKNAAKVAAESSPYDNKLKIEFYKQKKIQKVLK